VLLAPVAFAESQEEIALRAHRMSREVMSPFCPGRTLADCPSPDATRLREQIRDQLAAGVNEATVRSELEQLYGDAVIGVPRTGLGWALPSLLLLLGAGALAFALRRLSTSTPDPTPVVSAELESELDRELNREGFS
jgi:cytochrome c-type biogenesis protein CcmH/NrfF